MIDLINIKMFNVKIYFLWKGLFIMQIILLRDYNLLEGKFVLTTA